MRRDRRLATIAVAAAVVCASVHARLTARTLPPQSASGLSAQGDAAISGIVSDGSTGQPIADAVVRLNTVTSARSAPWQTQRGLQLTDSKGRFVFADLAPGMYTVRVAKEGHFAAAYGGVGPESESVSAISLQASQWFRTANVTLWRTGSLSGRITNERGDPMVGVFVRPLAQIAVAGQLHLAVGRPVTTDDRGTYRIAGLAPGRYIVMVPSRDASSAESLLPPPIGISKPGEFPPSPSIDGSVGYPVTFTGGARSAEQAPAVELLPGIDRDGVDVQLSPVATTTVSGTLRGPTGAAPGVTLRLVASGLEELGLGTEVATATTTQNGTFTLTHVPAGNYSLRASLGMSEYTFGLASWSVFYSPEMPRVPGLNGSTEPAPALPPGAMLTTRQTRSDSLWADLPISVSASPVEVEVILRPSITVSGRVVVEAAAGRAGFSDPMWFMNLETATGSPAVGKFSAAINRQGPPDAFSIPGVVPGLFMFRCANSGWTIKSAVWNGRDFARAPLDTSLASEFSGVVITVTNALAALSGSVIASDGTSTANASVIAFPIESPQWTNYGLAPARIKSTRTETSGHYELSDLPAGDYYVVALPASSALPWQTPGFFQRAVLRAVRVSLNWGTKDTRDLRVANIQ